MRLVFYAIAGPDVGYGHYYRTLTLHREATRRGHTSLLVTNAGKDEAGVLVTPHHSYWAASSAGLNPDWLILDLPGQIPQWARSMLDKNVCVIDGVGHDCRAAKLSISQGLEGEYCAPDYLVLRPDLLTAIANRQARNSHAFVFGGAYDPLGLLPWFDGAMPYQAAELFSADTSIQGQLRYHPLHKMTADSGFYQRLVTASFAVVSTGMIAWELAAAGVPTFAFSRSERHLSTALAMQERGWLKAWPVVGLPDSKQAFLDFCCQKFTPAPLEAGAGAGRIIELLSSVRGEIQNA